MRRTTTAAVIAVAAALAALFVLATCSSPRGTLRQPDPRGRAVGHGGRRVPPRPDPGLLHPADGLRGDRCGARAHPRSGSSRASRDTARWIDERTLEFTSDRPLPAGRRVRASVDLEKTAGFDFAFTVVAPSCTVDVGQLETADDAGTYTLSGTIRTSDREESAKTERILSARLASARGKTLPVAWSHDEAGLVHVLHGDGHRPVRGRRAAWSSPGREAHRRRRPPAASPSPCRRSARSRCWAPASPKARTG